MPEIILLRHGESVWNKENKFTGWTDIDLSSKGIEEVKKAAELLKNDGVTFNVAFTFVLKRGIAAHGNSLRALVKHLDGISDEEITKLNIPTGVPLLYNLDKNPKPLHSCYLGEPKEVSKAIQVVKNQVKSG